jgi:hypothetical protein
VVLEQQLREALAQRPPEKLTRMSSGQMLHVARQRRIVKASLAARLAEVVTLRNRAVHEVAEPTKEEAPFVLNTIREVLDALPQQE